MNMIEAEMELIALGEGAIPILETLFNGEARNEYGIPYRNLGLPLQCAMEVVKRLGPTAKPLEHYLRAEVPTWGRVAVLCLGSMGTLEEETIVVLADALRSDDNLVVSEVPYVLIRYGAGEHPAVVAALSQSEKARRFFNKTLEHLKSRGE
ncbi:hypothetical protein [Stenotrophomonas indicatrix]|uniref:hypothetical protein n=1 Tax=Stenotrophomonas indicatrix TaxID=2045451 RepID=UPI001AA136A4|nr:hypothetical protein [Stenotrophomonas indicatrix]MBO1748136.1 hypothetical protein [Stenotrophomonas indicatrix]